MPPPPRAEGLRGGSDETPHTARREQRRDEMLHKTQSYTKMRPKRAKSACQGHGQAVHTGAPFTPHRQSAHRADPNAEASQQSLRANMARVSA